MAAATLVLLATTTGCDDVEAKPKGAVAVGADALSTTQKDALVTVKRAVTSATQASGGTPHQVGDRTNASTCGELYPKRFQTLEVNGSFVVEGAERAAVVADVRDAWLAEGWKPKVGGAEVAGEDDQVSATVPSSSGVELSVRATVLQGTGKAPVNISVSTPCLDLSEEALADLDVQPVDED
ncbi:hypothetical protein [Aeromicrobium sp. Root495]|uniref:hypothetical protein n=1 Tax=Aeromicrobium sp. Root495 TaxID=1736550 RepID=UPI00138ED06C|nr:hypothetical protein [Aeromicrobium sp. Root495]